MTEEKISDKHDVLYHYTTMEGAREILKNQTLWATHFDDLNDSSELALLTAKLSKMLIPTVKQALKELRAEGNDRHEESVRECGSDNLFARDEVKKISEGLYASAFKGYVNKPHIFKAFITSFCSHTKDTKYIQNHGLLSMWRSYGEKGGVALVMNMAELESCLTQETGDYGYPSITFNEVVYERQFKAFKAEFGEFIELAKEALYESLRSKQGTTRELPLDLIRNYLSCVARYKHQAFSEEREVRIIAMLRNRDPKPSKNDCKTSVRVKSEKKIKGGRRLILFEGERAPRLPIKKIIVGPHTNQKTNFQKIVKIKQATKHLRDVDVFCSETPYRENK